MIQKMNGSLIVTVFFLCFLGVAVPAGAAEFDGSTPLFCAFSKAMECQPTGSCEMVFPEDVGLPTLIKVDFNKKLVTAAQEGKDRTTEIKSFYRADGQLILQGYEARSWSLIIGEKTGRMSLAIAGEDDGFILFGSCMAP
jgi:hypothetical protein